MDHETVDRYLATLTMILVSVVMIGVIYGYFQVRQAASDFGEQFGDPANQSEIDECNANPETIWDGTACIPLDEYQP